MPNPLQSRPQQSNSRGGTAGLEQRVLRRLRGLRLARGAAIVVGFSGGGDSLALTALLGRIARVAGCRIVAVHVDHGLRATSAAEATQVVEVGGQLGVDVRLERLASGLNERHLGAGLEEAARRERYLALAQVARNEPASVIAVAHHEDDQAETVLLHLLRGAGLRGACGMAEVTPWRVPWWERPAAERDWSGTLWRPLLSETRAHVRRYAESLALPIVEDESNGQERFRRNAVRLQALPMLNQFSPGATAALARYGRLAADDDLALSWITEHHLPGVVVENNGISRTALCREPVGLQRRFVRLWLDRSTIAPTVSANRVDAIVSIAHDGGEGREIEIGDGVSVVVNGDLLLIGRGVAFGQGVVDDDAEGPLDPTNVDGDRP